MIKFIDSSPETLQDFIEDFFAYPDLQRSREQMEQDMADWRADMLAQGLNPDEDDMELPF